VDSVTGFKKFRGADASGAVVQDSISVVPGSLLGKALVAQAVFNNGFLLPFAPDAPDFFLIPGDNQVTVLWKPSGSEQTGDPFFAIASQPLDNGAPNPLFDPNYRQFDVEGYRVYRGRVDSPNSLSLVAQFDYSGTVMKDFTGQINPIPGCAPELAITTTCPVTFDVPTPGVAPTVSVDIPLAGPIIQVRRGDRTALATGEAIILKADTALSGNNSGLPDLRDTGVPFIFVDHGVRSNLRYFYSVTAFDINSFQSGPASIESPRNTKPIIPVAPATNLQSAATLTASVEGRGVAVPTTGVPTIDPATGEFSGKSPAADGATPSFVGQFAQTIFSGQGAFTATLIGVGLGDARNGVPVNFTYQTTSSAGTLDTVSLSVLQPLDLTDVSASSPPVPAATADATLSARFGVPAGYVQSGQVTQAIDGYQTYVAYGRGCFADVLFGDASDCQFNGPRWFQGPNETKANPNSGNVAGTGDATDNNNAGELPGVLTIQHPMSYVQMDGGYRRVEATLAGAARAADFQVYWGAAGKVDSVVDITHNVIVPFIADSIGAGWGFLNQAGATGTGSADGKPTVLTLLDFGCIPPLNDPNRNVDQELGCTATTPYKLSDTAVPGAVAIYGGLESGGATAPTRPNPGFGMWLSGYIFMFELAPASTVPAPGTVWTMRSYAGYINGSPGSFSFTPQTRNFAALGADLKMSFDATNTLIAAKKNDLSRVHTVPDPYYVTNQFEQTTDSKIIKFVNLPADAIVRIYSSSGVLVSVLEHHSDAFGGEQDWNVRNRNNQVVASGVYFYHIEAGDARRVGRFTVVNFAQ
jgi:hypothetical protein